MNDNQGAQITRRGIFSCQVCVPKAWTDEQAKAFADAENVCGTEHGWHMRRQGDPSLNGRDERVQCVERADYVHVMFDA